MSGTLPGAVSSSKSPCPLTAILLSVLHVHTLTNDFPRAQIFIIDHGKKYRFQLFIADFSMIAEDFFLGIGIPDFQDKIIKT